jgi:hypothetical protein
MRPLSRVDSHRVVRLGRPVGHRRRLVLNQQTLGLHKQDYMPNLSPIRDVTQEQNQAHDNNLIMLSMCIWVIVQCRGGIS